MLSAFENVCLEFSQTRVRLPFYAYVIKRLLRVGYMIDTYNELRFEINYLKNNNLKTSYGRPREKPPTLESVRSNNRGKKRNKFHSNDRYDDFRIFSRKDYDFLAKSS